MRAMDVMTTNVITVTPDTSVQALATLLSNRGISGAPVVDTAGRLVGIVSEGDLIHRAETGTERRTVGRRSRWLDGLAAGRDLARDYIKSHGRLVSEIMTSEVVTVPESAELAAVADLMETKRVKRVPVVRDGHVVGIISRANLVRALATTELPSPQADADDRAIRQRLLAELQTQEWARIWPADIIVRDRTVHFWHTDDEPAEEVAAVRVAAENIAGVRGVEEHVVPAPSLPMM